MLQNFGDVGLGVYTIPKGTHAICCLRLRQLHIGVQLCLNHHRTIVALVWSDDLVNAR